MTDILQPRLRSSVIRVIFWMSTLVASGGAASFFAFGKTITEKFATALILPCGLIWMLLFAASLLAFFLKCRPAGVVVLFTFFLYTALGSGHLACLLVNSIEAPFRDIRPLQQEPFDKVIVLGGGGTMGGNDQVQGNRSGDRLIVAASLYHQGITKKLICTGSKIEGLGGNLPGPGETSASVLKALGVPDEAIEFAKGRTTSEELANLSKQFADNDLRLGIVTSAWHLPRALRLAESHKLILHPLPSNFLSGPVRPTSLEEKIKGFIPEAYNLTTTSDVIKEYLAMAIGR